MCNTGEPVVAWGYIYHLVVGLGTSTGMGSLYLETTTLILRSVGRDWREISFCSCEPVNKNMSARTKKHFVLLNKIIEELNKDENVDYIK